MKKINLTGHRFGRLVVISEAPHGPKSTIWLCRCDCGQSTFIKMGNLVSGNTKSCGCLMKELSGARGKVQFTTHGMSKSREFTSWRGMIKRCTNPNNDHYKNYGGRGITVCERWLHSFEDFYEDMGIRPFGMTLDRKDTNGNYCKDNCKWSTPKEQANNRRNRIRSLL